MKSILCLLIALAGIIIPIKSYSKLNSENLSFQFPSKNDMVVIDQKFCFDDTYGQSGLKYEITLFNNGQAKLVIKKDGAIVRTGEAKWEESSGLGEQSNVRVNLSTGRAMKFTATKSLLKQITMLIDSADNIWNQCFD
ncbi:MAG: hypothetical protein EBZ95_05440 [Chitinophagia bacterium]|jgi:hypothetical protein|nr:hypothetical protein [Chitinophagia bacterium]